MSGLARRNEARVDSLRFGLGNATASRVDLGTFCTKRVCGFQAMGERMATFFTVLFALACLAMFAAGAREQWKGARIGLAVTAVASFILALVTATVK
ncbi:MAG: hypothetical protein ABI186_01235 [Candidatus Elarobacter sp.]